MEHKMFSSRYIRIPDCQSYIRCMLANKKVKRRFAHWKKTASKPSWCPAARGAPVPETCSTALGFTTAADIVDMKGRVACEISTETSITHGVVFNGVFNLYHRAMCRSTELFCFHWKGLCDTTPSLHSALTTFVEWAGDETKRRACRSITGYARNCEAHSQSSIESKLAVVEGRDVQSFKVELMMLLCNGVEVLRSLIFLQGMPYLLGSYHAWLIHISLAHRSIRGSLPGFSKAWGTPSSNGRSRQGYW